MRKENIFEISLLWCTFGSSKVGLFLLENKKLIIQKI